MNRAARALVLVAVGFVVVGSAPPVFAAAGDETPAAASTEAAEEAAQNEDEGGGGGVCGHLPGAAGLVCSGTTGAMGGGAQAVVASGARAALNAAVEFVVDGAGWLLGQVTSIIDRTTRPDVTAGWFQDSYSDMALVAMLGVLPFLLLALIQGIVRQDVGMMLRATFGYVPLAALGTAGAIIIVDMLVTLTDWLSGLIGHSMGSDLAAFSEGLGRAVGQLTVPTGGVAGLAALMAAGVVAFATFVIWLELLLRQAAIYVAVLFLPIGFMAMVWPATAHWLKRLIQGLVAIILSKFAIVAVMALATAAMNADVGSDGYGVVVSGAAMLSLAALAPYVLLRLISVFDVDGASHLEGTLRRPTAAASPPTGNRGGISGLLRQRVGGTNGSDSAAAAQAATGGTSGLGTSTVPTSAKAAGGTASGTGAGASAAGGAGAVAVGAAAAGVSSAKRAGAAVGNRAAEMAAATGDRDNGRPNPNGRPPRSEAPPSPPPPTPPERWAASDNGEDA